MRAGQGVRRREAGDANRRRHVLPEPLQCGGALRTLHMCVPSRCQPCNPMPGFESLNHQARRRNSSSLQQAKVCRNTEGQPGE